MDFSPFSESVEPQSLTLAFEELPGPARLAEIRGELARMLDRAAGG